MKLPICAFVLLLFGEITFPLDASSQGRRLVVVSSRVGATIDSLEAETYDLFRFIKNFHSASFYQMPDATFWVVFKQKSRDVPLTDSSFAISYEKLKEYAEWIDHREALRQGAYTLGSSQPRLLYEDGSPLIPPMVTPKKTEVSPRKVPTDDLPLAPNTSELSRPIFQTIHLEVAIGISFNDFSSLGQLGVDASSHSGTLSFYADFPFLEDPSISIRGGWSFALEGARSFSILALCRPDLFSSFNPFFGVGAGQSQYSNSGNIIVSVSQSYGMLLVGMNLVRNTLDVQCTLPLSKKMTTTFESQSYTIVPAGPALSLLVSL